MTLAHATCTRPESWDFMVCFVERKACKSEMSRRQWTVRWESGVVGASGAHAGAGMLQRPGTITHLPDHDASTAGMRA